VQGFPAILALRQGKYYNLANGYTDKKQLYAVLDKLKKM
jgi:protein-disulfide isomerase-like protein with CxxC motif